MSTLKDPTVVPPAYQKHGFGKSDNPSNSTLTAIQKCASIPSLSSIVWGSIARVGDALTNIGTGLNKEEREAAAWITQRKLLLSLRLSSALTLREWLESADELDELDGNDDWKADPQSDDYDYTEIKTRLKRLDEALLSNDVGTITHVLRTSLDRGVGHIMNPNLYNHSRIGTKDVIDRYVTTATELVSRLLQMTDEPSLSLKDSVQIADQVESARQCFGRTALLLSGGATFGIHHIGVVKTLWETRLLPRIISGASSGSIVGAVLCASTDEEIPPILASFGKGDFSVFESEDDVFDPARRLRRFVSAGCLFDNAHLVRVMRDLLGDMTFVEAYNRTGRILNICVSNFAGHQLPWLLNFVTAPDVVIWSAIGTSCSAPLVFAASPVLIKDPITGELSEWSESSHWWIDGSVFSDLPISILSEMFNATHFIVSQVNPHVIPFIPRGVIFSTNDIPQMLHRETRWSYSLSQLARKETLHRMDLFGTISPFTAAMKRLTSVMTQRYYGDINILPEITQEAFPSVLQNPSTDFVVQACLAGERATWPSLGRIRNHCAVEFALDTALRIMRSKISIAASCAIPTMMPPLRPKVNEAAHLRKIIARLGRRSNEYDMPRSRVTPRPQAHHPPAPHRGLRSRKSQSALNEHPRNTPSVFPSYVPKTPGANVGFRPPLKRQSVSSYGPPAIPPPRELVPDSEDIPRVESPGDDSAAEPRRPSIADSYGQAYVPPISRIGSPGPSVREPSSKPSSWHIADDGGGENGRGGSGGGGGEWPASQMEEDPAAPALTLQALIMAAKTSPLSPEQEYRRLSLRTSDWEQQFGAN